MKEEFRNRVYTDRASYADLDSPAKFQAIQGIIATRLRQHPKAICSYSGGADSDILIHLIESTRQIFKDYLPPVKYVFFNTGLEMAATKRHVKETGEKYGVEIEECRPKVNIVKSAREHGIPFISKSVSGGLDEWQKKRIPLSIIKEYQEADNKNEFYNQLKQKYSHSVNALKFILSCDSKGNPGAANKQLSLDSCKFLDDFLQINPPAFKISKKCCDYCKKQVAHNVQKPYEMIITGEREAEGGLRTISNGNNSATDTKCFRETADGKYRFRPLYYVSDKDKEWYKHEYGIKYSDAYEVYGLTRTGCCGCPISYKAVDDLEKIRPYEPNVVKAAWNIFGKSYEYRKKYNEYKAARMAEEKAKKQKDNQ